MFIDTHTHIYLPEFDDDREEVIARARAAGAEKLLLPAIDEKTLPRLLYTCQQWPDLCAPMLGLHPTELPESDTGGVLERMEAMLAMPGHPFVAVGEVGVDLYWDTSREEEQIRTFRKQAEWAANYSLPLVIHSRRAHCQIVDTLWPLRHKLRGGIFHCFGGTTDEARELLAFEGFCLGIGGTVTFKKSLLPSVLCEAVPLSRIVLETDAPYLAPTPHRGQRNEPAYIPLVVEKLSEVYGVTTEEVEAVTTSTARKLFWLSGFPQLIKPELIKNKV